jgi:hypothetical protein
VAVTVITLLKRREGMSKVDFVAYYEEHHRRIGEHVLAGHATRYVRRYLHPLEGEARNEDPDVVMEIDFADEAARDACLAALAEPSTAAMIARDEARLFDRARTRMFAVEERCSRM